MPGTGTKRDNDFLHDLHQLNNKPSGFVFLHTDAQELIILLVFNLILFLIYFMKRGNEKLTFEL